MLNCNMYSKLKLMIILLLVAACSPLKEKLPVKQLVELEYVDPKLVQQSSNEPDHTVSGNLVFETQQDLVTGKTNLYSTASFHEPTAKNVLFDKVRTNALNKIVYKPKPPPPIDQPCGIPGFPDCSNPVTPPPPVANPDQPCGIPGFPDCPTKKVTFINE